MTRTHYFGRLEQCRPLAFFHIVIERHLSVYFFSSFFLCGVAARIQAALRADVMSH
jgi:hypothetical protein